MVIPSAQKAERPRRRLRHGCQSRPVRSVKFPPHRPPTPIGKANRRDLQMCKRATFAQVMGILALIAEFENDISYRAVCRERSGPTQRRSHRCVINAVRETLLRYWFDAEVCDVGLRRWSIELKHAYWGQLASVHYSRLFQWRKGLRWQSLRVIDLSVVEAATHRQQRGENRQSGDHTHHLTPSYATNVSSNIQPYFLARVVAEKPQRPRTFSDPRYRRATEIHHSLTISECYRRAVPN